MKKIFCLFCACASLLSAVPGHADELNDIKARGTLVCGTLGTADPFSFQDMKAHEIVGYDVDMCRVVATALKVKLQLKLVSVDARIPELMQGRVDILAANLGYSNARAQQIDFSDGYFVSAQKMLVRKDSGITKLEQLAHKRIAAIKGSSSEQGARRVLPEATIVTFSDPSSGFLAVQQGKTDALCASELVLVRMQQQAASTTPLSIIATPVFVEAWGLGMRKGEPAFEKSVNAALVQLEQSGQAEKIFEKWLGDGTPYKLRRDFKIEPIRN